MELNGILIVGACGNKLHSHNEYNLSASRLNLSNDFSGAENANLR